ncbi:GtrA family protein [Bacillus suaedaesalsae]|uniref:GtrA family protein n=1 Tax=Bacillus suaedaesalsae TaxID=2810349 RepID=A0ABS2DHN7_9BACI|nr:GtrA family protein [Bacillus suaedaesalsae]MBM6617081.1 GtrA family protein [Bacillus suaedaesalsae]
MNFKHSGLRNFLKTNTFIRFALVGVINTAIGLSVIFLLLNVFQLSYWVSSSIGTAIGALFSFLLNRRFTFKSNISFQKGAPRFFLIILISFYGGYGLGEWIARQIPLSNILSDYFSEKEIAVFIGACIYTISNYLGQKMIVFKRKTVRTNS